MVWELCCFEYKSTNHELPSNKPVYRTALATLGLLISYSMDGQELHQVCYNLEFFSSSIFFSFLVVQLLRLPSDPVTECDIF